LKIASVETIAISIPLETPVSDAVRLIAHRDHLIVRIRTADGLTGEGVTLAYDSSLAMIPLIRALFEPILVGASAFETERLWAEMFRQSIQSGRRGMALRLLSAIDIALWDLRAKAAGVSVAKLLGIYRTELPCYATGGYYREGQTYADLAREYAAYAEAGFKAAKLKVGKYPPAEDARRLATIRKLLGDDFEILLDANGGWPDAPSAIGAMRRLEEYRPFWIEEPVRADNQLAMARIAAELTTPVATGELEATRWAFANLLHLKAADILQPDAVVCGGVSEWLRIAHMAAAFDIPIAPHYHWDYHTQLLAAQPNGLFIEYFVRASQVKVFDAVVENPIEPVNGVIRPRDEPGFGLRLIEKKIQEYRIG
jgi:D-arabinonate dehydratase